MSRLTQGALAAMIDHTLLKGDATKAEIERLCREAVRHGFASVCVNPYWVNLAANCVHGSQVKVCTVIGFPLGANSSAVKAMEVIRAFADGAREFDMVINLGALKDRNTGDVEGDIRAVVKAAQGNVVKVILETCLLSSEEIVLACQLSEAAGANFVKTSTGFSKGGATLDQVRLMRKTVGDRLGVKASGGIRDRKTLIQMIDAGANRIGTSSGPTLIEAGVVESDY
jgi:deoxyribose-phosphate aldolase